MIFFFINVDAYFKDHSCEGFLLFTLKCMMKYRKAVKSRETQKQRRNYILLCLLLRSHYFHIFVQYVIRNFMNNCDLPVCPLVYNIGTA